MMTPRPIHALSGIGIGLIICCASLAYLSSAFSYGSVIADHPFVSVILLYGLAGVLVFPLFYLLPPLRSTRQNFLLIVGIGIAARLLFLPTTPIYEDDFYRYFWDGAVTAHGIDPFKHPPSDFLPEDRALETILSPSTADSSGETQKLEALAQESGSVIERINYPYIKTEYPLVAQAAFALSYVIDPWGLTIWRLICLVFEALTLLFIVKTLDVLNMSRLWSALYWWNPIAIVEIANRVHMEALLVTALAATVFFAASRQSIAATAALSLAVGIKFWPALLFPILLRTQLGNPRKLLWMSVTAAILCIGFLAPQLPNGLESNSGLVTYSQSWQTNSFAFGQLERLFGATGFSDPDLAARFFVFFVVSASAVFCALPKIQNTHDLIGRMLFVSAALFLLSPTQYPWYFLWFAPFLVFVPVWPLLAIPITLPLYFSRYYFIDNQQADFFDSVIVSIEFLPIFTALAYWLWRRRPFTYGTLHAA